MIRQNLLTGQLKMDGFKLNITIIALSVFLFLGGIFVLYRVYKKLYGTELWNRLDAVNNHTNFTLKSTKYLLIGDSRILQWKVNDSIIPSDQLFNYGIDAQTSGQVLQRAKDYFAGYHADCVLVQVGINDLKVIGFYPEKAEYIRTLTINNIKLLLKLCKKNKSTPIFITIILPGDVELKRMLFWNTEVNTSVAQVNNILVSYCKKEDIQVIDATKLLTQDGLTIRKEYQKDCLHLNVKGYELLNIELQKIHTNKIK